jgi:hypothetical protein
MPKQKQSKAKRRPQVKKQPVFIRRSRFFLPWPFIVFILLSIGVLLVGWTFQTEAADVHGKAIIQNLSPLLATHLQYQQLQPLLFRLRQILSTEAIK